MLRNFNQETLTLPALAAKLSLTAPTGIDAHGYGIELEGIVTKSIDRLSLHFNGGGTSSLRAQRGRNATVGDTYAASA